MKTGYKILDAMTQNPVTIRPDASLQDCAKLMDREHVGSVIVKNGEILGIISEQDIVRNVVARGINPVERKVEEFMETSLETIGPGVDIYEALVKMRGSNIRHLPVVDDGKMVGLLTLKDILKIEPQLFDLIVEDFNIREETRKPMGGAGKEGICQGCGAFSDELNEVSGGVYCAVCAKERKKI